MCTSHWPGSLCAGPRASRGAVRSRSPRSVCRGRPPLLVVAAASGHSGYVAMSEHNTEYRHQNTTGWPSGGLCDLYSAWITPPQFFFLCRLFKSVFTFLLGYQRTVEQKKWLLTWIIIFPSLNCLKKYIYQWKLQEFNQGEQEKRPPLTWTDPWYKHAHIYTPQNVKSQFGHQTFSDHFMSEQKSILSNKMSETFNTFLTLLN